MIASPPGTVEASPMANQEGENAFVGVITPTNELIDEFSEQEEFPSGMIRETHISSYDVPRNAHVRVSAGKVEIEFRYIFPYEEERVPQEPTAHVQVARARKVGRILRMSTEGIEPPEAIERMMEAIDEMEPIRGQNQAFIRRFLECRVGPFLVTHDQVRKADEALVP